MINILEDTISAINNFDITATVESLRKQYPDMSEAEISEIIKSKLTYLGSDKSKHYRMLLSSLKMDEVAKDKRNNDMRKMLMLLLITMFKNDVENSKLRLVNTFNKCWEDNPYQPTMVKRGIR